MKNFLGKKYFQQDLANRQKRNIKYTAVDDAKSIAIISDLSNDYTFNNIINFSTRFSSEGKLVTTFFCNGDKDVPNFYNLEPTLIDKSMINRYGIPNKNVIQNFIDTEYDFLFDFSDNNIFTIEYIFALSSARLKVSKSSLNSSKYADVCLALQDKNEVQDYLNAINNYLNISMKK
ncbi:hypothetical protein LJC30_01875 [Odoribacter sp. OttesenSCG-928-L07]|nr:hypothetical protein [Odoribacter sp. OttesenSCG-928-L07]MDL2238915.1 hypothetical protein [Bacteroidales bacterium OttesenSCG-928-L14]